MDNRFKDIINEMSEPLPEKPTNDELIERDPMTRTTRYKDANGKIYTVGDQWMRCMEARRKEFRSSRYD